MGNVNVANLPPTAARRMCVYLQRTIIPTSVNVLKLLQNTANGNECKITRRLRDSQDQHVRASNVKSITLILPLTCQQNIREKDSPRARALRPVRIAQRAWSDKYERTEIYRTKE